MFLGEKPMKSLMHIVLGLVVSGSCIAETIYVPWQYPTIQIALNVSNDGDVILVSPGTYQESINFNGRAVDLKSTGGPEVTNIIGQGNSYAVTASNIVNGQASLDGFTVNSVESWESFNVFCNSDSNITIENCNINGYYGLRVEEANVNVSDCSIDVWRWAVYGEDYANLSLMNSSFNTVYPNGVVVDFFGGYQSYLDINSCTFQNITCKTIIQPASGGFGELSIQNSQFIGNNANDAIMRLNSTGTETIINCNFENNVCEYDSAVYGRPAAISSCTFSNNNCPIAAVEITGKNTVLSNTLFCNNTNADIVGSWQNGGGNQFYTECGDVIGACCVDAGCFETNPTWCETVNGDWLGFDATCADEICGINPGFGACCINGEAIALYGIDCEKVQGMFMGEGTNPDDVTCPAICNEDVNGDGLINVSDLLAIIAAWGVCP
jgi:hypothetical protein